MPAPAKGWPGQSQEPGTQSGSLGGMAGMQAFEPSPVASQAVHLQEAGIVDVDDSNPSTEVRSSVIPSGSLNHCARCQPSFFILDY